MEQKVKDAVNACIGKDPLFHDELKQRIISNNKMQKKNTKKHKNSKLFFSSFKPIIITFLLIFGSVSYYFLSTLPEGGNGVNGLPNNDILVPDDESINKDEPVSSNEEENDAAIEQELLEKATDILSSLKSHNWDGISEMAHPEGVVFSFFADLGSPTSNEVVLSKEELKDKEQGEIIWGVEFTDEKIIKTKAEYVDEYLFKNIFGDSVNYEIVNVDSSSVDSGGIINTISTYFPDAKYVEYYSKPTEKEVDWQALRFVFKEHEGEWLLFGIVRDVFSP